MSYSCTENIKSVTSAHNKKLLSERINTLRLCKCRTKNKSRLNGKYRTRNVLYNWLASASMKSDKGYLETTERGFKQRFHNYKNLSRTVLIVMRRFSLNTFEVLKKNTTNLQFWTMYNIVTTIWSYSNITKKWLLCPHKRAT